MSLIEEYKAIDHPLIACKLAKKVGFALACQHILEVWSEGIAHELADELIPVVELAKQEGVL